MNEYVALDIETTGLNFTKDQILGVGLYPGRYYHFPQDRDQFVIDLKSLQALGKKIVTHEGRFDWKFLKRAGIDFDFTFDSKIAVCLLRDRPASSNLESLASFYLKQFTWKSDVQRKNLVYENPERVADYCMQDCKSTWELAPELNKRLEVEGQRDFYFKKLLPLYKMLMRASYQGIKVNTETILEKLKEYEDKLEQSYNYIRTEFDNIIRPFEELQLRAKLSSKKSEKGKQRILNSPPRINFDSSKQLTTLLKDFAGLDPRDRDGKPSTSTDALFYLADNPLVMNLIRCRDISKAMTFFRQWLDVKDDQDFIHSDLNVDIARTGRLSSSEPNLQQIPVRKDPTIRDCFIARPGHKLIINDLSNIEPRFIAHYSQDPDLVELYKEGWSLYGVAANKMGLWDGDPNILKQENKKLYAVAKTIVLGIFYNAGARKISFTIQKEAQMEYSERQCRGFIQRFFDGFPKIRDLKNQAEKIATQRGYIRNFFGRHVLIPRERAYMTAFNSLIQSSASDYMCFLQFELYKTLPKEAQLLLLVHDEMIWEVPLAIASDSQTITLDTNRKFWQDLGIRVPIELEGGICDSWGGPRTV